MRDSIFREEAIEHRSAPALGRIIIARPVPLSVLCWVVFICMCILSLFFYFGTYAPRVTVQGLTLPTSGVNRVELPMAGIIEKLLVGEGQVVVKGQPLFEIASEGQGQLPSHAQHVISRSIKQRIDLMHGELQTIKLVHIQQLSDADRKVLDLKEETVSMRDQLSLQETRATLLRESAARFSDLHTKGFISSEQLQSKRADELEAAAKHAELKRQLITTLARVEAARAERAALPLRHSNEIDRLTRENSIIQQDLDENEAKRKFTISAPINGTVTAVNYFVGQSASSGRVLATIVPENVALQVQLYVPSRAIASVHVGGIVNLRFPAFPYQRYGTISGRILASSTAILTSSDLTSLGVPLAVPQGEGLYRVIVILQEDNKDIPLSGLKSGMSVEGDILDAKRPLYQWIFEPIRGASARL